ncbi:hypothetical protein LINPERHAP1_LOCUS41021 [Linum perenne]
MSFLLISSLFGKNWIIIPVLWQQLQKGEVPAKVQ